MMQSILRTVKKIVVLLHTRKLIRVMSLMLSKRLSAGQKKME